MESNEILTITTHIENQEEYKHLLKKFINEFNISMLKIIGEETAFKPMEVDKYLPDPSTHYFYIYYGKKLVGFFGLNNNKEMLTSWVVELYLEEDYRIFKHGNEILLFVKSYMALENLKYLRMGVFNIPEVISLCTELGFTILSKTLIMKV